MSRFSFAAKAVRATNNGSIEPMHKCDHGNCQNDSTVCGFYDKLITNIEDDGGFIDCSKPRREKHGR